MAVDERYALVVVTDSYEELGLGRRNLTANVLRLATLLGDSSIGGFAVTTLHNPSHRGLATALQDFFDDRQADDVLLLYLASPFVQTVEGGLHLAAANTTLESLASTAVPVSFVIEQLTYCRSRRVVVLLDCEYAGLGKQGAAATGVRDFGLATRLAGPGRVVISGGSSREYAFEPESGAGKASGLTAALVRGLETGEADADRDGWISLEELPRYLVDRLRSEGRSEAWMTSTAEGLGTLYLARRPDSADAGAPPDRHPGSAPTTRAQPLPQRRPSWRRRSLPHQRLRLRVGDESLAMAGAGASSITRSLSATIQAAVKDIVRPGRLLFNPPTEMRQGRRERVEVAIARSRDLDDQLRENLRGRGVPVLEDISTSPFMTVVLQGAGFEITPLSATDQLVGLTARWEFDVVPTHAGNRTLQLLVSMRVGIPARPDERIAIPVLERNIHVRVDPIYGTREFVGRHWQWIVATAAGLGGAVGAWLQLIR